MSAYLEYFEIIVDPTNMSYLESGSRRMKLRALRKGSTLAASELGSDMFKLFK